MVIEPFIFNWKGKSENSKKIFFQLNSIFDKVKVINSDDHYCPENWINIGDEFYFSGQFKTALKNFSGDILFHIQGDVSYDRWEELVSDAIYYFKRYDCGIYSPNIDYTWYTTERFRIEDKRNLLRHQNLDIVGCTDETVWFIHKDIINQFKDYNINLRNEDYGWGIDLALASISFLNKKLVLRDKNHKIIHPRGTNYDQEKAEIQFKNFRKQLPKKVDKCISLIKREKQSKLYKYLS